MNPEFQRYQWLEVPSHRLLSLPAVLLLVFLAAWLGGGRDVFPVVTELTIGLLVIIWGTRLAADAVLGEVVNRTWDNQRMSAMTPWDMTWGKLLGSTIYTWYGAGWCVVGFALGVGGSLTDLLRLVMAGLEAQALALMISLLLMRRGLHSLRGQVTAAQFLAVVIVLPYVTLVQIAPGAVVPWYGLEISATVFAFMSQMVFLAWTVGAIYWLMRVELQYPATQWPWVVFVAFVAFYAAGFDALLPAVLAGAGIKGMAGRLLAAFCGTILLTYAATFVEPKDPQRLKFLVNTARAEGMVGLVDLTPTWAFGFGVAVVLGLVVVVDLMLSTPPGTTARAAVPLFVVAVLLFTVRDISMIYILVLHERARRGHSAAVVYLILVYFVAPVALSGAGQEALLPILWPNLGGPLELVVIPVLIQAVIALVVVSQRWRAASTIQPEHATMP
ncbi:conserved membrane hypothetical protein [uncultured Gammaproteobacteria bacterium]